MNDSDEDKSGKADEDNAFLEGRDFYFENGLIVLTRHYLLYRGHCCERGCRHCPYEELENKESK